MITQYLYETFRDNINALIQKYREKFSLPVIIDSKKYEETYRKKTSWNVSGTQVHLCRRFLFHFIPLI